MAGPHSGAFGVLGGVSTVRNWQISDTNTLPKAVASNTQMGTLRRGGVNSWAGSYSAYGALPYAMPGSIVAFAGYTAPDSGVGGTNGQIYSGNVIIDSVAITWDWKGGGIISQAVQFSGHLGLANASAAALTDTSAPEVPPTTGTFISSCTTLGGTYLPLPNVSQAVLTFTAANAAYVNSSTAGNTGRAPGPIDWTLAITQEDIDPTSVSGEVAKLADLCWKVYDTASTYWLLQWGKVKEFSNITVDIETAAINGRTINVEMNGVLDGTGIGSITAPGAGSAWWPA